MDERLDTAGAVADLAGTRQISLLEPGDPDRIGPYGLLCRLPRGGRIARRVEPLLKGFVDQRPQLVQLRQVE